MTSKATNPHDLVIRRDVEIALRNDKGPSVILDSFEMKDFTNKGDNYACAVSSVIVKYKSNDKIYDVTYIVKLNPQTGLFPIDMMKRMFDRETGFYEDILPLLNKELEKGGEPKLRMPKHFHSVRETGKEVIYLEDLRKFGYKMHHRQEPLDKAHTMLIVKELSRLHSSSYLVLNKEEFRLSKYDNFIKKYPFIKEILKPGEESTETLKYIFSSSLANTVKLIDGLPGYEYASKYLKEKGNDVFMQVLDLKKPKEPFIVICHGDCWNNNFLFRYSPKGEPVECRLLDLQGYEFSSGTTDLNHFLFSSVGGECRKSNMQSIFECYYATFASVLCKSKTSMPLTLPDMKKDFRSNAHFGLVTACLIVPSVLLKSEDLPKLEDFKGDNKEDAMKRHAEKVAEKMRDSHQLKPRLLDVFDELKEYGVFSDTNVSNIIQKFSIKE